MNSKNRIKSTQLTYVSSPWNLSQVPPWDYGGGLVVDTNFKPCWAPVYKLYSSLSLDSSNSSINILGYHIAPVYSSVYKEQMKLDLKQPEPKPKTCI